MLVYILFKLCIMPYASPFYTHDSEVKCTNRGGGWDGLDGLDGDQKCPLNFFILCEYIDYVYVYLYKK